MKIISFAISTYFKTHQRQKKEKKIYGTTGYKSKENGQPRGCFQHMRSVYVSIIMGICEFVLWEGT